MSRLRALWTFLYDFVIGDDPLIAAVVVLALGLTAALDNGGIAAWWLLPVAVVAALGLSLRRATLH
jgi:hydrogenase/urease accessory protein HupE